MDRLSQVVNLLLKFLHVLVHGIGIGGVSGEGLAELSFKSALSLSNFLINLFDNLVHLLSFAYLAKDVSLEL